MRNRILSALVLAGALLFLAPGAHAQTQTNVTATITDPNGIPYAGGTYSIQLIPTGTNPAVNGNSIGGAFNGQLSATGSFNVSLWPNASIVPAGTTWQFTICSNPGGIAPPLGTGTQCTPPTPLTISGTSQNLSTTLSAVAPKLTNFITTGGGTVGPATAGQIAVFNAPTAIGGSPALTFSGGFLELAATNGVDLTDASGAGLTISETGTGQLFLRADATSQGVTIENDGTAAGNSILNLGGSGGTFIEDTGVGGIELFAGNTTASDLILTPSGSWEIDGATGVPATRTFISTNAAGDITIAAGNGTGTPLNRQLIHLIGTVNLPGTSTTGAWGSDSPTIASGFGTSPSIPGGAQGTLSFQIQIGSGGTAQTGVLTFPPGIAAVGWNVLCSDETTQNSTVFKTQKIGAGTTTSATIGNFTNVGVAGAWAANDLLDCTATAY